jgi:hypothetical protein
VVDQWLALIAQGDIAPLRELLNRIEDRCPATVQGNPE